VGIAVEHGKRVSVDAPLRRTFGEGTSESFGLRIYPDAIAYFLHAQLFQGRVIELHERLTDNVVFCAGQQSTGDWCGRDERWNRSMLGTIDACQPIGNPDFIPVSRRTSVYIGPGPVVFLTHLMDSAPSYVSENSDSVGLAKTP